MKQPTVSCSLVAQYRDRYRILSSSPSQHRHRLCPHDSIVNYHHGVRCRAFSVSSFHKKHNFACCSLSVFTPTPNTPKPKAEWTDHTFLPFVDASFIIPHFFRSVGASVNVSRHVPTVAFLSSLFWRTPEDGSPDSPVGPPPALSRRPASSVLVVLDVLDVIVALVVHPSSSVSW